MRRARSVWEELIRAEVHPDRLSYRGMGEVLPATDGSDEAALAANRRVEFHIVRQYASDEDDPTYRPVQRAPWDGEAVQPQTPVPVRETPSAPGDPIDVEQFLEEDQELFRDEDPAKSGNAGDKEGEQP